MATSFYSLYGNNSDTILQLLDRLQAVTTAYDVWIAAGNNGTQEEFLDSLIGPLGDQGPPGEDGIQGLIGETGAAGLGLPTGGGLGQFLVKTGSGDYEIGWANPYDGALDPTPITITTLPIITGNAIKGENLSCTLGEFSGSPTTRTRQWKKNGADIVGATSASYTILAGDIGSTISCAVTASRAGVSSVTATSVSTSVVTDSTVNLSGLALFGGVGTIDASVITNTAGIGMNLTITGRTETSAISFLYVVSGTNPFPQITGLPAATYNVIVTQGGVSTNGPVDVLAPSSAPTVFATNVATGVGSDWINPFLVSKGSELWSGSGAGLTDSFLPSVTQLTKLSGSLTSPIAVSSVLQQDGHSMPALYVRPDGRLVVMWTAHESAGADGADIRVAVSTDTSWTTFGADVDYITSSGVGANSSYVYTLTKMPTSGINWSMHRGTKMNPVIVEWDDNIQTVVTPAYSLVDSPDTERPYMRCVQVGNRMDFSFSRSNPGDSSVSAALGGNTLYHMYYDDSTQKFYRTNGTLLRTLTQVRGGDPILLSDLTPFYDGITYGPGWIYHMEQTSGVIQIIWMTFGVASALPVGVTERIWWSSRWNGSGWDTRRIGENGGKFGAYVFTVSGAWTKYRDINTIYVSEQAFDGVEVVRYKYNTTNTKWGVGEVLTNRGVTAGLSPPDTASPYVCKRPFQALVGGISVFGYSWEDGSRDPESKKTYVVSEPAVAIAFPNRGAGILTTGTVGVGTTEVALAAKTPFCWVDPSDKPTLNTLIDGTGTIPLTNGNTRSILSKQSGKCLLNKTGSSDSQYRLDRAAFKQGAIGLNTNRIFIGSPAQFSPYFAITVGLTGFISAAASNLVSSDAVGSGISGITNNSRIGSLLNTNGTSFGVSINRACNTNNTQGVTAISYDAGSAMLNNPILSVYGDGNKVYLRLNGVEVANVNLLGTESFSTRIWRLGGSVLNTYFGGFAMWPGDADPLSCVLAAEAWMTTKRDAV